MQANTCGNLSLFFVQMMNRRKVRELVLQALYAFELSGDTRDIPLKMIITSQVDAEERVFAEKLYLRTIERFDEMDAEITKRLNNWDLTRLALVDKIVLRMALAELIDFPEIPTKVTINEAIEIAKKFSTSKSGMFVNGILDSACQDLVKEGRINKTGRGLIDTSNKK
jgi:N utilization substance protein B